MKHQHPNITVLFWLLYASVYSAAVLASTKPILCLGFSINPMLFIIILLTPATIYASYQYTYKYLILFLTVIILFSIVASLYIQYVISLPIYSDWTLQGIYSAVLKNTLINSVVYGFVFFITQVFVTSLFLKQINKHRAHS